MQSNSNYTFIHYYLLFIFYFYLLWRIFLVHRRKAGYTLNSQLLSFLLCNLWVHSGTHKLHNLFYCFEGQPSCNNISTAVHSFQKRVYCCGATKPHYRLTLALTGVPQGRAHNMPLPLERRTWSFESKMLTYIIDAVSAPMTGGKKLNKL